MVKTNMVIFHSSYLFIFSLTTTISYDISVDFICRILRCFTSPFYTNFIGSFIALVYHIMMVGIPGFPNPTLSRFFTPIFFFQGIHSILDIIKNVNQT